MRPLIDLHSHVEGTIYPSLLRRLAQRNGVTVPAGLVVDDHRYQWANFTEFLETYDVVAGLVRSEQDYRDVVFDHFERTAAMGQVYGEIFVSPDHGFTAGLSYGAMIDAMAQGLDDAQAQLGVTGRMVVTCVRHLGVEKALEAARLAVEHPHRYVVGFGMAGDERLGRVIDFKPAFDIAREAGLGLTVHAGEVCGPESVVDALDHLRPNRIGHGVQSVRSPALMDRLVREGVTLEVCPGSNIALGLYESYNAHAFGRLRQAGCRLTLGADDPPFFGTDIGREYDETGRAWQLDGSALDQLTDTALDAAFCDDATKARLREQIRLARD
jgi:adenosine deaminase